MSTSYQLRNLIDRNGYWFIVFEYKHPKLNKVIKKELNTGYQAHSCFGRKARKEGERLVKVFIRSISDNFDSDDGLEEMVNRCFVSSLEKPMNLIRTRNQKIHIDFHYIDPQTGKSTRYRKATGLINNNTNRALAQQKALKLFHDLSQLNHTEQVNIATQATSASLNESYQTIEELIRLYQEELQWVDAEETTQELYTRFMNLWIRPFFKDVPLSDVNLDTVKKFRNHLAKAQISGKYKNAILSVLKQVIKVGFQKQMLTFFDISTDAIKKFREAAPNVNALKPEERKVFLEYVKKHEPFYYPALFFTAYCGVRDGELKGLRWKDIDFDEKSVFIQHSITSKGKFKLTKTSKARHIYLTDDLIALLKQHRPRNCRPNDFVFLGKNGQYFAKNRLTKVVSRSAERCGLKHITMHSLRHTVASILANNYNILLASKALGHSDIKTTMAYYHTDEEKLKAAMRNQDGDAPKDDA